MANSAFGKQIQNRNFLSGVGFKFNLAKFPKVDFFSNSARIPELNLELTTQPSYLKTIDVPGERLTFGDFNLCEEGCLSYPDKFINVRRPDKIYVIYEDEEGKEHKIKLEGFPSRVFQHEYDHLEGIDFTQRQ